LFKDVKDQLTSKYRENRNTNRLKEIEKIDKKGKSKTEVNYLPFSSLYLNKKNSFLNA
jgi:hypothetical protein